MKKGLKRQLRDAKEHGQRLHQIICAILTEAGGDLELPDPPKADFKGFTMRKNETTDMIELEGIR